MFVAGFVGALFFQDNDPNTDDGAAWGVLIFIAGGVLTAVYLVVGHRLNSRNAAAGGGGEDASVAPDTRSWPRRNLGPLAAGAAGVVVVIVASAFAPPSTSVSSPTAPANRQVQPQRNRAPVRERTAAQPSHIQNPHVLAALIKAAASAASSNRSITSVDCVNPVNVTKAALLTCAVTFDGPACQLWLAGAPNDPEPKALGSPAEGRRGRVYETTARCE